MNFDEYKPAMSYPGKPIKPRLKIDPTPNEIRAYADEIERYEQQYNKYLLDIKEYNKQVVEGKERFWKDCFEHNGIKEDHPKAKKLREIAWSYGHSAGFGEVWNYAEELAELIE